MRPGATCSRVGQRSSSNSWGSGFEVWRNENAMDGPRRGQRPAGNQTMRALSVKQPWANLIASGRKTIETRTWATPYRGTLLIVSSKRPNIPPAGSAVAIAELVDCRPMTRADEGAACCGVYPNAVSWVLEDVRRIRPFPVRGALGVFHCAVDPARLEVI